MTPLVAAVVLATGLAPRPAHAEPQVSDIDRQLAAASARLEVLVEQHNAARSDLAATRARADAANGRIAEVQHSVAAVRGRVSEIAAWAYKTGPTTEIGAMLAAGSPDAFISRLAILADLSRADQRDISDLIDSTRGLADEEHSLRTLAIQQAQQEAELAGLQAQVETDIAALKVLREQIGVASRNAHSSTSDASGRSPDAEEPPTTPPAVSAAAGRAVAFAYAQLGKPYEWGADGPGSYDCSGLTSTAWQAAGITLPHNAARQYAAMRHISRDQLQPGDLVFYYRDIHHVAMYVGNGNIIHAPTAGDHVRVQRIDNAPVQGYGRPS